MSNGYGIMLKGHVVMFNEIENNRLVPGMGRIYPARGETTTCEL